MRHYSKEEITEILKRHKNVSVVYTQADRESALQNPSLEEFKAGLLKSSEELKATQTEPLRFSLFRRFAEDGNRGAYEKDYFNRRKKLSTYALEYWLYEKPETLVYLQDVIWAILDEYSWCLPAHFNGKSLVIVQSEQTYTVDLFAAETAQALSEILALLGDAIHPLIRERAHSEIERRVLSRVYAENGAHFWWYAAKNNWAAVCGGSVGMAAIYEMQDEERLAFYIEKILRTIECFESGFPEDGTCLEGFGYWNYGFGYFMYFADMLARRTEGEINLFDDPHIKNAAFFYTKVFFNGARTVSFSDGGSRGKCSPSALAIISRYYPDFKIPTAEFINFGYSGGGCSRFALTIRDLVLMHPEFKSGGAEIVGTYKFPYAGWYISSSKSGVGIAVKAGHNNEPHNHNDIGSFLIYKNGKEVISDIGAGEYTRQYFSAERYTIFCNSSASHSVPVINGEYQMPGADFRAKDVQITDTGLSADIAGAYGTESLKSLKRDVKFDSQKDEISISDSFIFDKTPDSVVERFISSEKPEILDGKVLVGAENAKMAIYYEADEWSVKIDTVIDKDHAKLDRTTYTIDFTLKNPEKKIDAKFFIK